MALLFRINILPKRLTTTRFTFTNDSLNPWLLSHRNVFTNGRSRFANKKDDDIKVSKCTDFEQFFTKTKKSDTSKHNDAEGQHGKPIEEKRKPPPPAQQPIFGHMEHTMRKPSTSVTKPPSATAIAEKKVPSFLPQQKSAGGGSPIRSPKVNIKRSQSTPDEIKPQDKPQIVDVKKPFSEFVAFPIKPLSSAKNQLLQECPPEKKEEKIPPIITAKEDNKTSGKDGATVGDGNERKSKQKYLWLAAAAAALCGVGLAALSNKSSSNGNVESTPKITIKQNEPEIVEVRAPSVLPKKVPYLIIGGGTASWSAFKAIKEHVPNAKVLVVSNELHPPYKRPPLSKVLGCTCPSSEEFQQQLYFEQPDFFVDPMLLLNEPNGGVSILNNRTAKYVNLCERKVVFTDGTEIEYENCLLATGSQPRNLIAFQTAAPRIRKKISFFKSLNDFENVKEIASKSESVAVIGGGFLASEISMALSTYASTTKKLKIYQVFHEDGNMGMTLPRYLSQWMKNKMMENGLFVIPNTQVDSVHVEKSKLKLGLLNGQVILVDHVIVALGSQPDHTFAQRSGLKLANCGIAVNENLEALPHLYVAGDAACLPGNLGKETETSYDHALASGRLAGENMTGQKKPFTHQSKFSSVMAPEISFESVGRIDSALKTVGVFSNGSNLSPSIVDSNRGVVFYLKNDRVVGILLWNIFNKISIARQVIAEGKKLYDLNEVAKRFEIQE